MEPLEKVAVRMLKYIEEVYPTQSLDTKLALAADAALTFMAEHKTANCGKQFGGNCPVCSGEVPEDKGTFTLSPDQKTKNKTMIDSKIDRLFKKDPFGGNSMGGDVGFGGHRANKVNEIVSLIVVAGEDNKFLKKTLADMGYSEEDVKQAFASCENPIHSDKEIRQEKHIQESEEKSGKSPEKAEEIGWATINKNASDNRALNMEQKLKNSNKTKSGLKYFEPAGTQDQPKTDKYKNKRKADAANPYEAIGRHQMNVFPFKQSPMPVSQSMAQPQTPAPTPPVTESSAPKAGVSEPAAPKTPSTPSASESKSSDGPEIHIHSAYDKLRSMFKSAVEDEVGPSDEVEKAEGTFPEVSDDAKEVIKASKKKVNKVASPNCPHCGQTPPAPNYKSKMDANPNVGYTGGTGFEGSWGPEPKPTVMPKPKLNLLQKMFKPKVSV